jgi:Subtilisin inhibitor-like
VTGAAGAFAALVLAVGGCGSMAGGIDTSSTSSGSATVAGPPATSLTVDVYLSGKDKGLTQSTTLECDPVGGTNPLSEESCRQLAANPESLDPVPEDAACTQEYGGPDEAHLYGTVQGEPVDAWFSKANGCEIARWSSLEPMFKVVVG